jgi:predicted nucleic acid-binding protein
LESLEPKASIPALRQIKVAGRLDAMTMSDRTFILFTAEKQCFIKGIAKLIEQKTLSMLLDTNIILQLIRNNNLVSQQLESDYKLVSNPNGNLISYVTVDEIYALSLKFCWGKQKIAKMNALLEELIIIDIGGPDIADNYAQIDYFSEKFKKTARPMGQNDIWIAATATALGAKLMTTDADFDHLHPKYIQRIKIDANTGETIA